MIFVVGFRKSNKSYIVNTNVINIKGEWFLEPTKSDKVYFDTVGMKAENIH
jgi:hypothetical protein